VDGEADDESIATETRLCRVAETETDNAQTEGNSPSTK
jgi:hypothetical protein